MCEGDTQTRSGCVEAINNHASTQQMTALINTSHEETCDGITDIAGNTRSTKAMPSCEQ